MSYFNFEFIKKIKSINCYEMPHVSLSGIFKNREISDDGMVTWFNAIPNESDMGRKHYIQFEENVPNSLYFGYYTEENGEKTLYTQGDLSLTEAFNIFSIDDTDKGLNVSLEREMYKDIKLNYTESDNPEQYLNKIFKFSSVNEEGAFAYFMENPPSGSNIALTYNVIGHYFTMQKDSEPPVNGVVTNDNTLNTLVEIGNAFNDYFQFIYFVFISSSSGSGKGKR